MKKNETPEETYEINTIFGTFYKTGKDAEDARRRFWEWYWDGAKIDGEEHK